MKPQEPGPNERKFLMSQKDRKFLMFKSPAEFLIMRRKDKWALLPTPLRPCSRYMKSMYLSIKRRNRLRLRHENGAEGGTRTPTGIHPLDPEPSASTSSATSAFKRG
jgi:hypothetical protein